MYLVGKYITDTGNGVVWDFQGIFSSKEKAVKACRSDVYFIAPVTLDKQLPDQTIIFPDFEYPLRK